jgi:beta-lactamase regulating signal transducer with metallopeptidase domain
LLPIVQRAAEALLGWLATYAIHSTILILLAAVIARSLSRRGRPVMSALWGAAVLGGVLTATLQSTGFLRSPTGTVHLASHSTAGRVRLAVREARGAMGGDGIASAARHAERVFEARLDRGLDWQMMVVLGWLASAGAALGFLLLSRRRFLALLADRVDGEYTLAGAALREVRRRAGVTRAVRVSVSRRLTSPVALGADEICLPARALAELDPIQLETILAHELAHLRRRDPMLLVATRVVEALFFFQPLNRWARRRMQDDAEFASDAWAVRVVTSPLTLARCLARVAEWTVAGRALPAPAMAEGRTSSLVERVRRLTNGDWQVPPRRDWVPAAGACALLALGALAPTASIGAPAMARTDIRRDAVFFVVRDSLDAPLTRGSGTTPNLVLLKVRPR